MDAEGTELARVNIDQMGGGQVVIQANTYPAGTYFYTLVLVLCKINPYRQFRALVPLSSVLRRSRSYGYDPSLSLGQSHKDSGIIRSNLIYKALDGEAIPARKMVLSH